MKTPATLPPPCHPYGYTKQEVLSILKYRKVHHRTFWKAFGINTCTFIDDQIFYHPCDVERALAKILKYRKVYLEEED